jgi:hypothetical protein
VVLRRMAGWLSVLGMLHFGSAGQVPGNANEAPWHEQRICVHVSDGEVGLAPGRTRL